MKNMFKYLTLMLSALQPKASGRKALKKEMTHFFEHSQKSACVNQCMKTLISKGLTAQLKMNIFVISALKISHNVKERSKRWLKFTMVVVLMKNWI
jgi:hypothetical protein